MTMPNGKEVVTHTFEMEDYLKSCVSKYLNLAGPGVNMKTVATPLLADDQRNSPARGPSHEGETAVCTWCKHACPTKGNIFKPYR